VDVLGDILISQFKTWGFDLINYTNGGGGCTFANQTSFKKSYFMVR
jgi:hypothetical protein